jgi:hypothetical protein
VTCKSAEAVKKQLLCEWSCIHELGIDSLLHGWVRRSLACDPSLLEKHIPVKLWVQTTLTKPAAQQRECRCRSDSLAHPQYECACCSDRGSGSEISA